MGERAYERTQDELDHRYEEAWKSAPAKFRADAAKLGIKPKTNGIAYGVIALEEGMTNVSTQAASSPEIDPMDIAIDNLVERFGARNESLIREIVKELHAPMLVEAERNKAAAIGRIACYLVKGGAGANIQARIHQLLHAIPMLAPIAGFDSLRKSAAACGVSVQWIKTGRDKLCEMLCLPVPVEGTKKAEAKKKYSEIANSPRHWRRRKFLTQTKP